MPEISTAKGTIDSGALGRTFIHEHVFVINPEVLQNYPEEWDEQLRVADAIEKLTALKAAGIDTIFDPTVVGLGRYIPRIVEIANQIELNIVVATGVYTYDSVPKYFRMRGPLLGLDLPDPMADYFIRDITQGIADTGVKAAFLKCAVEEKGLTPGVERVARAVALTHRETGAPITVHTNAAHQTGTIALNLFESEGVDLTKVVVGHSGDTNDQDYLRSLMDRGATIGMDRFGLDMFNPTENRVATIASLVEQGYADRMVLAHDASCYIDFFSGEQSQQLLVEAAPNWHYNHIPDDVLPALVKAGVAQSDVDVMMVDNARRYFGG